MSNGNLKVDTLPWIEKYRPSTLDGIISQDEIINAMRVFIAKRSLPHLLLYGLSGVGKCLDPNTPVLMFDGSIRQAKDIKKGDLLMGDDNRHRLVLNTTVGLDVLYRINQNNGDSYVVNSEHIISLKLTKSFIIKKKPKKYKLFWFEKHIMKQLSFNIGISYFEDQLVAYTYLQQFKKMLKESKLINRKGDICDISIKNYINKSDRWKNVYHGFKSDIISCWNYDMENSYSYGFRATEIVHKYKNSSVRSRLELLAGLIDQLGYVKNYKIFFDLSTKNQQFSDDLIFICRSLGFLTKKSSQNIVIKPNMHIPTKIKKINYKKTKSTYKINIIQEKSGNYCGFEIDGNRRFLLGDFTVTHNTSSITACAKELYGKYFPFMVMELNASDDRGIEVVRNKIKQFVMSKNVFFGEKSADRKGIFKLVILDETDAMTPDAQAILKKIVEKYTDNTRFCLICNYIQNINSALQSRCTRFRFSPINEDKMRDKINEIAILEKISISEDGINTIIKRGNGDLRKVLNILQSASLSYKILNEKNINLCLGYPREEEMYKIMEYLINDNFKECHQKIMAIKIDGGLSLGDIISEIHDILVNYIVNDTTPYECIKKMPMSKMSDILDRIRMIEYNNSVNTLDHIQFSGLIGIFKS
jgi:replication factor C subunit 3/5